MRRINMQDIKCGQRFWECERGGNIEFEAMADATVTGDKTQVQARNVATGEPQAFMVKRGWEYYGPQLYDGPAYITPEEAHQ